MTGVSGKIVIVGAGHAGFQLALALRQAGYRDPVVLVGDEPGLPYQRPPLSKAYLLDTISTLELVFRPEVFFVEQDIQCLQATVTGIDSGRKRIVLGNGDALAYDHLVLATGARPRQLTCAGHALSGVHSLATMQHADKIKTAMRSGCRSVAVIGAGFIGLEFVSVATKLGMMVSVVDVAPRAMARAVSPEISTDFENYHRLNGVAFHFSEGLSEISGKAGSVTAAHTPSGAMIRCDMVLAGVGVLPNDAMAAQAGLAVDNGIIVNERLETSVPDIYAIGDCANFPAFSAGGARCRIESVQNATDQARLLAGRFAHGRVDPYRALPWFWSDQGELKLQIAGLSVGCNEFVVSADEKGKTVYCFRNDILQAVETINRPGDHMAARRVLSSIARPTPEAVSRPDFTMKNFTPAVHASISVAPSDRHSVQ